MLFIVIILSLVSPMASHQANLEVLLRKAEAEAMAHESTIRGVEDKAKQDIQASLTPCPHVAGGCKVTRPSQISPNTFPSTLKRGDATLNPAENIVFISASMPRQSLKALALSAKRHGFRLVMRGLVNNSFGKTSAFYQEMGAAFDIHPQLFHEYGVSQVPVMIIHHRGRVHKFTGNMSLEFALDKVAQYQHGVVP